LAVALLKDVLEPGDGGLQALLQGDGGLPAQLRHGEVNEGLPLGGVVGRQGLAHQRQFGVDAGAHQLGQLADRELPRIAEVDRAVVVAIHQPDQAPRQIIHIAERAGLAAVAVEGERPGPTESPAQGCWCGHAGAGFVGTAPVCWPTLLPLLI